MFLYLILGIAVFSAASWLAAKGLIGALPFRGRSLWIVVAGLLPTALIIIGLVIWDQIAWREYLKGPREGYMSPLVGLIYGFPWLAANLVGNMSAAVWSGKRQP